MCPTFQPGLRVEWRDTIPARATVPQLYHDTPFCLARAEAWDDVERVCEGTHERCVIGTQRFNDKLSANVIQGAA